MYLYKCISKSKYDKEFCTEEKRQKSSSKKYTIWYCIYKDNVVYLRTTSEPLLQANPRYIGPPLYITPMWSNTAQSYRNQPFKLETPLSQTYYPCGLTQRRFTVVSFYRLNHMAGNYNVKVHLKSSVNVMIPLYTQIQKHEIVCIAYLGAWAKI